MMHRWKKKNHEELDLWFSDIKRWSKYESRDSRKNMDSNGDVSGFEDLEDELAIENDKAQSNLWKDDLLIDEMDREVSETEMVPLEEEEFRAEQNVEVEPPLGFERPQSLSTYKLRGPKENHSVEGISSAAREQPNSKLVGNFGFKVRELSESGVLLGLENNVL
ncbi:hypothetical protein Cgig2_003221 [Carnegiea gigantea]|uniref:Uncharacterized protein n=1 Tax=Carnegiea gigantea TaxID=171969 RepID=A0A9Q1JTX8_9CARY|nr:hypothetical protein Cgig2_003221 [Carnegiea gigantea]